MDRITEFTITRIKMQGFKAFAQEREFFFRSTSYISGANGQGKTTIGRRYCIRILRRAVLGLKRY